MPGSRIARRDLRQLLMNVLPTDSDQDAFVIDYFTSVFRRFASGMDRPQKLNILFEAHEPDEILAALEHHQPERVRRYFPQPSTPSATPATPSAQPTPVASQNTQTSAAQKVVCLHAERDRDGYAELRLVLRPKLRDGGLTLWSPEEAQPGEDVSAELRRHVESATMIVLLVSSDLLDDSDLDVLIRRALERRMQGQCIVVPVVLRATSWQRGPFGTLQPLPRDGQAIRTRRDRDTAWVEVAEGLLQALQHRPRPTSSVTSTRA